MPRRLFLHNKPIIGLDISETYIKAMSIDHGKWRVTAYGSVTVEPQRLHESLTGNNSYLSDMIHELIENNIVGKLPSDHVVVSVPTNQTYNRAVSLPIVASKKIASAIFLEAEQYIPVPLSELNVSYEVLSKDAEHIEALMCAAPKKVIENIVMACEKNGLEVVLVQPGINAVAQLIIDTEEGHLPTVIVDIGATSTEFAILNMRVRANASIRTGGNSFTSAIATKLHIPLEQAHQQKVLHGLAHGPKQKIITAALRPSLMQISNEIEKIIRYYQERIKQSGKIEQIILVGSGSNVPGLADFLTNELLMPVRVGSPWQVLDFGSLPQPAKQFRPRYITVAGNASLQPKGIVP